MAESILRLKVSSEEYDNKLKRASEAIQRYAEGCRKAGGTLTQLDDGVEQFVKELGNMETVSNSARGKISEMTKSFTELSVQYNKLTEEEKNSPFGKALTESLETLKGRIKDGNTELKNIGTSLNDTGGVLGQLASKFTVNIDALKLFDIGIKGAKAALDVAKDAFFASEATVDEWGRTMQSAQGLYEGFLNAINNGDISGYLNHMGDIVRAAREAYNAIDTLHTMQTIQAPGMSRQQLENDRIRQMIQTGRYIAPQDGRANAVWNGQRMKEGQLLTQDQIKLLERQLQGGLQKITGLVKNEVNQTGKAIDAYYNSLAKQNGMSLQEFKKGTSTWEEFSQKMRGYEEYKKWDREARAEFARQGGQGNVDFDKSNPFAEFKKWGIFRVDKMGENSYNELVGYMKQRDQLIAQIYSNTTQAYRAINRAEGITTRSIMGGVGGRSGGGGYNKQQLTEYQENQKKINELTQKYTDIWGAAVKDGKQLTDTERRALEAETEEIQKQIQELEKRNGLLNYYASKAKGLYQPQQGDFDKNVGKFEMNPFAADDKAIQMTGSLHLQLDEESMKSVQSQIGKNLAKDGLTASEAWSKASRSISAVSSALSSVENPATKIMGTIGQAIATIALAYAETLAKDKSSKSNIWYFIGTAAAAMISMATTISSIHSSTGYAQGGIVDGRGGGFVGGTAYSGDNIGNVRLDSGELVLNKSQQANLASQLRDSQQQPMRIVGVVKGENIALMLDNYGKASGRGELAFWK